MNQLTITIKPHEGGYQLHVQSMAGENVAGERLSRSFSFEVGLTHFDTIEAAEEAQERLQDHLDSFYGTRRPARRKATKKIADANQSELLL